MVGTAGAEAFCTPVTIKHTHQIKRVRMWTKDQMGKRAQSKTEERSKRAMWKCKNLPWTSSSSSVRSMTEPLGRAGCGDDRK